MNSRIEKVAEWRDDEYVIGPEQWHSADGDIWTDDVGLPVDDEEFVFATIRFAGGPRDGSRVG